MSDRWIHCFDGVTSTMLLGPYHQTGSRNVGEWLGAFDRSSELDSVEAWKLESVDRNLLGFKVDLGRLLHEFWRRHLELIRLRVPQATVSVHLSEHEVLHKIHNHRNRVCLDRKDV